MKLMEMKIRKMGVEMGVDVRLDVVEEDKLMAYSQRTKILWVGKSEFEKKK